MRDPISIIFYVIVLIMSVVIHEVAHGAVADSQGDPTAKYAGRLTLNPFKHLDLFGSFIFPLILALTTPFVFGWAKPVPVNPYNFRDKRFGEAKVAVAGVAANFAVALFLGLLLRFLPDFGSMFFNLMAIIIATNLGLAVFNLMPVPPLDGSHILFSLLPRSQEDFKIFLQRYGFFFLIVFILFFSDILVPIIDFLFYLIVGVRLY